MSEHPENHPLANGIRTDHPIPGLPFVDDSHIPIEDPHAVEATGRGAGDGMWGREDRCGTDGGWTAFTTDPHNHHLAWTVRYQPGHGRSVTLWPDADAAGVHDTMWLRGAAPFLFRTGGYWYDGTSWYRPAQVFDWASEEYARREVPMAASVTAADSLEAADGDPRRGTITSVTDFDPAAARRSRWADDLALWAARRPAGALPLAQCIVSVTAPELAGDKLVSVTEFAGIAGIAPSTLRAYISRGEESVPSPQAVIGGRSAWARPVAEEWAERRRRDNAGETVAAAHRGSDMPVGRADICSRFEKIFYSALWGNPAWRKRWALRWRIPAAVRDVAADLAWYVAEDVGGYGREGIISASDLAVTIRHAFLDELATGQDLDRSVHRTGTAEDPANGFYGVVPHVARMLDWLIRHNPDSAQHVIGEIIGEAERRLDIPSVVSERSLRTALSLDGKLDKTSLREFLALAFTPQAEAAPAG